ncbi:helix-turn-helix domain-containing protein [Paraglaciecola sp. L3A3]|uniref:helix-turn-helix domain-containing protein n=1 Tax=Paraglaciecola sp. L3A3 TaxID=2686358 RepID=UPI00131BA512|nr:helix-turn-helix domain-containing protein [Paraglaciecola sp. L3A3]
MNKTHILQSEFVRDAEVMHVFNMYNLVPEVMFWVKDIEHRFIFANKKFLQTNKLKNIDSLLGKNDFDIEPKETAIQLRSDDKKILQGQSLIERVEVRSKADRTYAWILTSIKPMYNRNFQTIGSYGVSRIIANGHINLFRANNMQAAIDYITANFKQNINIERLADLVHLSVSAFQRNFKKIVNKTASQLIAEVRMDHAKALLIETKLTIADVGYASGFSDHSYFNRQFRRYFNMLPSEYREKYQTLLV